MVTYRASKIIMAPIKYVYDWATDYTEEDNSIWGGRYPRIILLKSRKKCVYASFKHGSDGNQKLAVRVVMLNPSKYSWHLDYYAEEDLETGEYKLTRIGKDKTRLDMVFKNTWKVGNGPSTKDFERETNQVWQKYIAALESDYDLGKKARQ